MEATDWQESIQIATYRRAEGGGELRRGDVPVAPTDEIVWVNLALGGLDIADRSEAALSLHRQIADLCPGIEVGMLEDLLEQDLWPRTKTSGTDGAVRAVSAARMWRADTGPDDADTEEPRGLAFQLVELIASDGWIISCWHQPTLKRGAGEEEPALGTESDEGLYRIAEEAVRQGRLETAGDLGLLILQEVAASYAGAIRSLYDWLEDWEFDFYQRSSGSDSRGEIDRQPLIDLRALVYQCRKCVSGINAPQAKVKTFWFAEVTSAEAAERLDETIDRTLRRLTELSDRMRSAFDVAQLQIAERQAQRTERLQQNLDLVAAVLLVPTLIAGAYGANTNFPGRDSGWGTAVMLLLMAVGGALTYSVLRLRRRP